MSAPEPIVDVVIAKGSWVPAYLLNANERGHWGKREKRRSYWRELAYGKLRTTSLGLQRPLQERVHIFVEISWPDHRRRDAANWHPTAKAIIDGIVDAKVLIDDSNRYLVGPDMRSAYGPHQVRLVIYPLTV